MKKWMYLIFPGVMLGIFLIFYISSERRMEAEQRAREEAKAQADATAAAQKKAAEEAARVAAQKRLADQKAEEKKKEDDRLAKYEAQLNGVKAAQAKAKSEADARSKEAGELELQLNELHNRRDRLNREDFDLLKQVELARVKERDAELDIQRMVTRIAQRAAGSQMVQVPPPPPQER